MLASHSEKSYSVSCLLSQLDLFVAVCARVHMYQGWETVELKSIFNLEFKLN